MRASLFLTVFLAPLCAWAGEGVPVTTAGISLQGRSDGAFGASVEGSCSVPYIPLFWGGAGGGLDSKEGAAWFVEGGLGFPIYMLDKTMFLLTTSAGTGSHGDFVGISLPVLPGNSDSEKETTWYLSPYARAYAWMDEPDYELGLRFKYVFTTPSLSRLF